LKIFHKDVTTNSTICNLERFQDVVYGENLDVVCVNETWLNENFGNVEILHSDYTIFRTNKNKLVLICSVKEFSLNSDEVEGYSL
jgi:hypothetical protein